MAEGREEAEQVLREVSSKLGRLLSASCFPQAPGSHQQVSEQTAAPQPPCPYTHTHTHPHPHISILFLYTSKEKLKTEHLNAVPKIIIIRYNSNETYTEFVH